MSMKLGDNASDGSASISGGATTETRTSHESDLAATNVRHFLMLTAAVLAVVPVPLFELWGLLAVGLTTH
jgi:hypothetical protein